MKQINKNPLLARSLLTGLVFACSSCSRKPTPQSHRPQLTHAEPQKRIKLLPITLKKDKKNLVLFLNVDEVTILEPFEQPTDNEILSQMMSSDNLYHRIVSIMKQSTQEYYNMRMVLGLEVA